MAENPVGYLADTKVMILAALKVIVLVTMMALKTVREYSAESWVRW